MSAEGKRIVIGITFDPKSGQLKLVTTQPINPVELVGVLELVKESVLSDVDIEGPNICVLPPDSITPLSH